MSFSTLKYKSMIEIVSLSFTALKFWLCFEMLLVELKKADVPVDESTHICFYGICQADLFGSSWVCM